MRHLACFLAAALVSAAVQTLLSACSVADDCDCPPTPEAPDPQVVLPINEASAYTPSGSDDVLPIDPRGGEAELTRDELIIRYEDQGGQHEVIYSVESAD